MNALSLYSGGCDGISLAGSWMGITTLAYCDSEPACRAVLRQRHPDAPIFDNDEDVTPDALRTHGIDPTDIDIVLAAPPCQIASCAGKRLGAADPRNRWPQFLRTVRDLRPRWVMAENVPALLSAKGKSGIAGELFGDIIAALAEVGYRVGWCCYGAADVGAPHRRERLFIVGHAEHARQHAAEIGRGALLADAGGGQLPIPRGQGFEADPAEGGPGLVTGSAGRRGLEHARGSGREERDASPIAGIAGHAARRPAEGGCKGPAQPGLGGDVDGVRTGMDEVAARLAAQKWPAGRGEPQFEWESPRVATKIPDRAARIRMIGNSCPPQQYAVILAAIVDADQHLKEAMMP